MQQISYFDHTRSTKPTKSVSIQNLLDEIKFGTYRQLVEAIRANPDNKRELKIKLPCVTISGIFTERNQDNLVQHSGYLAIDIDNYSDRAKLIHDEYTYALFDSVSGSGMCVIIRINPDKHKESFRFIQKHYFTQYGIIVDPAPSNIASLRYISYDPNLYQNDKAKLCRVINSEPKKPKSLPIVLSDDRIGQFISNIADSGKDIAPTYEEYLHLSFALVNGFGENGRNYFHALCQNSPKYDHHHADKQYDIALKRGDRGITIGTFYHLAKCAGFDAPKSDSKAVQIAAIAKQSGRNKADTVTQLTTINGLSESEASSIAEAVFSRDDITLSQVAADPNRLIESLFSYVSQEYPMRYNSIKRKIILSDQTELTEQRLNTIYLRARALFNTPNVTADLIRRMIYSDMIESYHPLIEYIEQNRHISSSGHIDKLISTIQTDTPYAAMYIKKWYVSLIAAIHGNPVRSVLALLGEGNTGKTEWFRRLLPKQLESYYGESRLESGKDDEILMCEKLILLDDELGGKSQSDAKRFKELSSKSVFSLRAPYGRTNEDFKRLSVLCGTSNEIDILTDPTGNTRILPIVVNSINHDLYNSIDKDALFMEAVSLYESGYEWRLNRDELNQLESASIEHESTPIERELILRFFEVPPEGYSPWAIELSTTEIKDYIETNTRQQIRNVKRLGIELRRLFGKQRTKRINGAFVKVYRVIQLSRQSVPAPSEGDPF